MTKRFIPLATPLLTGNEKAYVVDCIESSWISSCGKYVEKFERAFADFCGVRHAVSCSSGTAALHVALLALGVGPGDEVIVPTLTFVSTANAVTYCGARPRFVDIEPDTWTLDPGRVEAKITARTKAIVPVHLYGYVANMDDITEIARRHNLFVVEDAAEAHGAEFRDRRVGSLSDVAAFSFYGNKIIACGEGGMMATDSERLARYMAQLRGQGVDSKKRYWFPIVGYNYRMPNLTAAVGLAQLERIDWHLNRRREVASWYTDSLRDVPGIAWQVPKDGRGNVDWLFTITLSEPIRVTRDDVIDRLSQHGVETRPVFHPMHTLPPYREMGQEDGEFPVAEQVARSGLSLPTWAGLQREDVVYVCDALRECIGDARSASACDLKDARSSQNRSTF
ncbi:MAG: DegT/DnrJ/EryC1/StrS family aminotransferase [Pyrinomonadaceae bacterium]|nr:DegT/DnrJ/EryC1/StrS family aminotransferase [Pyrinomonadaceae bacterium]